MSTRQTPRGTERERCTVSIEGLSSSTTDAQLQNLLKSIGPIEVGQIQLIASITHFLKLNFYVEIFTLH